MRNPVLPKRYLAGRHAHRVLNQAGADGDLGIGFLPHPAGGGYRGVFPIYGALLLLRGSGVYRDDKGHHSELTPGCFIQRLPDRWHETTVTQDGQWMECYLTFGLPLYHALSALKVIDPARPVTRPGVRMTVVEEFYRLLQELRKAPDHALAGLVPPVIALAEQLMHDEVPAAEEEYAGAVDRVARELAENFDRTLRLEDLLTDLPVGYERFRKIFKQRMGLSPGEYRIRRRIERAIELLHDGELRLYQIARQLGYPDAFAFSKQFTRLTGRSPSRYRNDIIGGNPE